MLPSAPICADATRGIPGPMIQQPPCLPGAPSPGGREKNHFDPQSVIAGLDPPAGPKPFGVAKARQSIIFGKLCDVGGYAGQARV
jgi:hypothetical protein